MIEFAVIHGGEERALAVRKAAGRLERSEAQEELETAQEAGEAAL